MTDSTEDREPDFSQPWKVSDIVLLVDDARLHVHSGVLAMWSPVFVGMFADLKRKNSRVLTLEHQKPDEIRGLLLFIYPTISHPVDEDNCYFLLELAKQFQMPKVTERCEEYLQKTLNTGSEVVDLLVLASKYNMRMLRDECLRIAKQLDWKVIQQHNLYEQIDLKDYRTIAEQKLRTLLNELDAEKQKVSQLEEEVETFRRHKDLSNAPSSSTVNPGLASPRMPRKQIVQPSYKSKPMNVVFNSKAVKPVVSEHKEAPPVPKRSHYPAIKPQPIIKEF